MSFFKFQNITSQISFTAEEKAFIDLIPKYCKKVWNGSLACVSLADKGKIRDKLVKSIKEKLYTIQEPFCIYCGIHFDLVGVPDREHIVPKGKHPEFVLEEKNLALACRFCNGSSKKHTKETVDIKAEKYEDCTFKIVHPYEDKYEEEIDFAFEDADVIISAKDGSDKGQNTIDMFELDGVQQSSMRGGAVLREAKIQDVSTEFIIEQIRQNKYLLKK